MTARKTEADLRSHLQALLTDIAANPGQRGNVVLVTAGEAGVGTSSVARSLNAAALERGMLSVLIEIAPGSAAAGQKQSPFGHETSDRARVLTTTAGSLSQLLLENRDAHAPSPAEDVRSEFDLVVIDAPALQPATDVAAISAHADFTIFVVADGAADAGLTQGAQAALSKSGTRLGVVINKMPSPPANPADQTDFGWHSVKSSPLA
jgi:Mrp family chromosome partitioning ATPase